MLKDYSLTKKKIEITLNCVCAYCAITHYQFLTMDSRPLWVHKADRTSCYFLSGSFKSYLYSRIALKVSNLFRVTADVYLASLTYCSAPYSNKYFDVTHVKDLTI